MTASTWYRRATLSNVARLMLVLALGVGLLGYTISTFGLLQTDSSYADSRADWLVTKAFADGINPYGDLMNLAGHYDVDYVNPTEGAVLVHPRTPGALVMQLPLVLFPAEVSDDVFLLLSALAIVIAMVFLCIEFPLPDVGTVIAAVVVFAFGATAWSLVFFTQSPFVLLFLTLAVVAVRKEQFGSAGFWIALAGTLKVFPLFMLVPLLLRRRYRAIVAATLTVAVLNLMPVLFPHVALTEFVTGLSSSLDNWFMLGSNISIPSAIDYYIQLNNQQILLAQIVVLLFAGGVLVARRRSPEQSAIGFALTMGALASPLAWPHYLLALVPSSVAVISQSELGRRGLLLVGLAALAAASYRFVPAFTISAVLLAVAFTSLANTSDEAQMKLSMERSEVRMS